MYIVMLVEKLSFLYLGILWNLLFEYMQFESLVIWIQDTGQCWLLYYVGDSQL